jgi:urease accessory protein UreF
MNGFNRKVAAIQSNSVSFPVGLFSFPAGVESASDESR